MLANQLTQNLSKKLIIAIVIVALGSDIALYLSRESYFMEIMYSNILLFSILVGVKLAPRLKLADKDVSPSKRKLFSMFVKAFFILYSLSMVNDFYSSQIFTDYSESQDIVAEDFISRVDSFEEDLSSDSEYTLSDRVLEWLDSIGYDFYNHFTAGLEEVWRLSYIVLFLFLFKKLLPRLWEKSSKDTFLIMAVILSSFLFGVGHSLSEKQEWTVFVGTVVSYTNMGLIFGCLVIYTRNLWLLVFIHGLYNVLVTLDWSYSSWTMEGFVLLILVINGGISLVSRIRANVAEAKSFEL
jgi:membrane protease YdiL (CAAX protease family)